MGNFSSMQLHEPYAVGKLSISWAEICIFSRTGRKIIKLRRTGLFPSMILEHGLLEGSTILFWCSHTSRTALESSRLAELRYAISVGQDVRLKSNRFRKENLNENWNGWKSVPRHGLIGVRCEQVQVGSSTFFHADNFLRRSYTSRTLLESPQSVELKWFTSVKDGLVEGWTILFQCSYTSRMALESTQLVELKMQQD